MWYDTNVQKLWRKRILLSFTLLKGREPTLLLQTTYQTNRSKVPNLIWRLQGQAPMVRIQLSVTTTFLQNCHGKKEGRWRIQEESSGGKDDKKEKIGNDARNSLQEKTWEEMFAGRSCQSCGTPSQHRQPGRSRWDCRGEAIWWRDGWTSCSGTSTFVKQLEIASIQELRSSDIKKIIYHFISSKAIIERKVLTREGWALLLVEEARTE